MPQYATLYLQYCMGHAYNASHRITRFSWRRWGDLRIDLWSEDNTKALYRRSLAGWMFGKCCMPRMGGSFSKLERFILGQKYKHTLTNMFSGTFLLFLVSQSDAISKMVRHTTCVVKCDVRKSPLGDTCLIHAKLYEGCSSTQKGRLLSAWEIILKHW